MLQVGEQIPDIELTNDEGKKVKLSDYRGQKVVLYFYPKDFTPGCELQACNFRDNYASITEKNAIVLGISADSVESHQEFRKVHNLPFNLLVDTNMALAKEWNATREYDTAEGAKATSIQRSQWVIDANGVIVDARNPVKANESLSLALGAL